MKCKYCQKEFDNIYALSGHVGSHNRTTKKEREKFIVHQECLNCEKSYTHDLRKRKKTFCSRECSNEYSKKTKLDKLQYNVKIKDILSYHEKQHICEICGAKEKGNSSPLKRKIPNALSRDHNHETGNFRGLLCYSCNVKLGWYEKFGEEINQYLLKNNDFSHVKIKMGL